MLVESHPSLVERISTLDVGILKPGEGSLLNMLIILCYQLWNVSLFLASQVSSSAKTSASALIQPPRLSSLQRSLVM